MSDALVFRCASCGGLNRVARERLGAKPTCGRCKTPLDLSAHPADITDAELDRLVRSAPVPVLVDFWAPWCGPCRAMAPELARLAKDHAGKIIVAKVNTDEHGRTASRLGIQAIPTLAVWRGGELVTAEPGARLGRQLDAFVAPFL